MRLSIFKAKVFAFAAPLLAVFVLASGVLAQSGTSGISGTIVDQTGAVVPGATVTITNPATGLTRTTTSNVSGRFSFAAIPPATYRLEITAAGFKKVVSSNVQALVDSPLELNFSLEPGDVSAVVDVTTGTIESVVNTQDATIGNNFVPEQITQLPTDLRRVNDLLSLQPGVTRDGYVAGGRSDQANITLDGVDINDQQTGGRSGSFDLTQDSALRATTESVEEFRITTTGSNANQGRSSGAQISLVTKSGTNNLRGSAFYFYRPTFGSANNFFSNLAGRERPSLARSVYGGTIGGPIKKDKLFFFYSYEGQYQKEEAQINQVVPLAHMAQGSLRFNGTGPAGCVSGLCTLTLAQLNTIYASAGINPAAVAAMASAVQRYPSNNTIIGDGLNTGGFLWNAPTTDKENTHIARFDWNPWENQQIFFRANYQWDNTAAASAFPDTPAPTIWSHPSGFVAGHNWTISNNKINNFRYGLTRQAFSTQGDSNQNAITFRFVFSPLAYSRTLSRVTPVQNITNDFTWIKGDHTMQFGGNIRIIRNERTTYANAYDFGTMNPSFYASSGAVVNNAITAAGYTIAGGSVASVQAAATALIGRLSQYNSNFTFDKDGSVLPSGTPAERTFATEEYDVYMQDVWKAHRTLTLTMGLRYALSRPVYEQNGFQVVPSQRLGDVFERRKYFASIGLPNNELINFVKGGPANNGPGFYSMDWDNIQPSIAAAWSPDFKGGFLRTLFGKEGDSVFRGGFRITNDYFGGQLAVSFDGLSTIGFTSSAGISANACNVTDRLCPRFTGYGMAIRPLPGIPTPTQRFSTPADEAARIETSLDGTIKSPTHWTWNFSYGRSLPKGMYIEASYIGRRARDLFGTRDVMALNNLKDPATGMDWYTAANILHTARANNVPITSLAAIPYFENLFPNARVALAPFGLPANNNTQAIYGLVSRAGFDILDWTYVQLIIDDATEFGLPVNPGRYPNMFFHPQYAAFSAYGTFAKSDYHGGVFTMRQRLGEILSYDINYTFSKSMDDVSGLQTDGSYGGQFLLNPLRPEDQYAVSDFDTKHVVNANFLFDMPIGKGRKWFSNMNSWADAFLGGWSLRGIYRWNTGQPISVPFDQAQWATNWNVQSNGTRIRDIDWGVFRNTRNIFANPQIAFSSMRNARPGETGERNTLRLPGFQTLDLGLSKTVTMPWNENHKFQFRWEVFNVTNIQYFDAGNITRTTYGLPQDPETSIAPSSFGRVFDRIQGVPRRMQFGFRYQF